MLATYACALLILLASLVVGRALLTLLGTRPTWLSAPVGFALLVTTAPILVRLPGRATTAAILLGLLLVAAALVIVRKTGWVKGVEGWPQGAHLVAIAAVAITIAVASLPFLFNERLGVLGEGIYTNDHAAQLYWSDWLQNGFGPQPSAVRFGYPTGPQAVAVVAAEVTGGDLVEAFNGLLLAIPGLTVLAGLAALGGLPPARRLLVASLSALPYLAASFLAQSAFKETAMALFVLAFAICLSGFSRGEISRRAGVVALALLAVASLFTFSLPGLAWFVLALPGWLALEALAGRRPVVLRPAGDAIARHRLVAGAIAVGLLAVAALAAGPAVDFVERINEVQASAGRLGSPIFPGEALGVWPEGDFRLVRGDVAGAIPATLFGLVCAGFGIWALVRGRDTALLAMVAAAVAVYLGTRLVAEIHVEAKALAVMAPLVTLIALRALLVPSHAGEDRRLALGRYVLGGVLALALAGSTLVALRAAPVGFDQRAEGLERLGERIEGETVAFLGVDRFGGYRLRGTLVRSPGGYVPPEVAAREEKVWQQGKAMDLDTLAPYKLDQFDYAITTEATYQSTPPPSMRRLATDGDYVLWERTGKTPRSRVLDAEGQGPGNPGAALGCAGSEFDRKLTRRPGEATVLGDPVLANPEGWRGTEPVDEAAAGQEDAFLAPATATQELTLEPGSWNLSLQYHSQAPLKVTAPGLDAELPPSLDGMYLTSAGRGAFWPVGEIEVPGGGATTVSVAAEAPSGLQDALGVGRRVWLGNLAAVPAGDAEEIPMADACGRYLDRFTLAQRGG